ncbi:MAG TPA: DUF4396 domain-containing protein [Candidatus Saccharimonadales bacterium]|nr:DUF4396 domain-containing protein [Candidatus Saccharimonadales bacterium]
MFKQAISHTLHCLLGCGIGEILGMAIGSKWNNILQTALAVFLAFFFGYLLTFRSAKKHGQQSNQAVKTALATDTLSITSMELIDNTIEWLVPGAINATLGTFLFWWSLGASLAIAFIITVPVNYIMISRGIGHSYH